MRRQSVKPAAFSPKATQSLLRLKRRTDGWLHLDAPYVGWGLDIDRDSIGIQVTRFLVDAACIKKQPWEWLQVLWMVSLG